MEKRREQRVAVPVYLSQSNRELLKTASQDAGVSASSMVNLLISRLKTKNQRTD